MKLLALDTATEACSVAVAVDGEYHEHFELGRRHSEGILVMVEAVLADAGLALTQLDAIAFGRGPGLFTGLRIGAGVTQGLAFAAGLPVVPVSSLAALAQGTGESATASHQMTGRTSEASGASVTSRSPRLDPIGELAIGAFLPRSPGFGRIGDARVLAAIDARMNQVYWGAFTRGTDGLVELVGGEVVSDPAQVPVPSGQQWVGAGSGWDQYHEALLARLDNHVQSWRPEVWPRARDVAVLGAAALAAGGAVSPEQAAPVYIRDDVAVKSRSPGAAG
jgi:tRNA threonylcarbamoyladenosine biosynthesis protein TsaB